MKSLKLKLMRHQTKENIKIGIGITTFWRSDVFAECLANVRRFTTSNYNLHIAHDSIRTRKGVAKRKNECLYNLRDCDYIFLFDDDCFPIKKGWEQFVINAHKKSGEHHFNFLVNEKHTIDKHYFHNDVTIQSYKDCGGVFMSLTKDVISQVGGFCTDYGLYGLEHVGYSCRVHKSKLISEPFLSIQGLSEYLFAHDYSTQNFQSSIDESKKLELLEHTKKVFEKDVQTIYKSISYE